VKGNNQGNGSWTGIVASAIVGAAVGAGIALLFAPRTGKESRDWLVRSTRKIKNKATGALEQARDAVSRENEIAHREAKEIASANDRSW